MSKNKTSQTNRINFVLLIIVVSQFCCTSLWFAGNSVLSDLVFNFNLNEAALGYLTSSIQFGFISGTLVFATLTITDRYAPSKVFFLSALMAAIFNLGLIWSSNTMFSLLVFRFATGFFLAGIYPVGMKIAADYFEIGLGKSLGFLVGALVLGTAFPHLLKGISLGFSWQIIVYATTGLALLGGLLMLSLVPNGPFRRASSDIDYSAFLSVFKNKAFRSAAFGYFGHMWELYAFWAFVPIMIKTYVSLNVDVSLNSSLYTFLIIGTGSIACVISGYLSLKFGVKRIALIALSLSGLCCLLSPLLFMLDSLSFFLVFLLFWGMVVIADSPMFSTLVAQNTAGQLKGTALTIVNCIGFGITIISIQIMSFMVSNTSSIYCYIILGIGPLFGIFHLIKKKS
ncbi:MAG: MFS transporter [Winogradskyella sp.]|nr:MFS transporter [Winogradskyella sp.]